MQIIDVHVDILPNQSNQIKIF